MEDRGFGKAFFEILKSYTAAIVELEGHVCFGKSQQGF
jgi:hypothetical protein